MAVTKSPDAEAPPLARTVTTAAAVTLVVLAVSRLVFHLFAGPLPDEAYYWLWGQHPALSYFDHPPLQAWMQAASNAVFGDSLFALRIPSLITTAWIAGVLACWARRAHAVMPEFSAWFVTAIFFASPMLFIYTMIVFNDHLMVALLLTSAALFVMVFERAGRDAAVAPLPLYGAALALGLATLTKHNAALFGLGVAAAIMFTPRLRILLRSPHLYLAALLSIACLTPVMVWNLGHDGASFQYNLVDRINVAQPLGRRLEQFFTLTALALLTLSPFLVGPIVGALRSRWNDPFLSHWRALALGTTLVPLAILLVLSQFTAVLFYWTIVAWVAAVPLAAIALRRRWVAIAHFTLGATVAVAYTVNYAIFPLSALFGPADHESAIVYGWDKTTLRIVTARQQSEADFLLATDYRVGAILAFSSGDRDVEVISNRKSQFDLWFDENRRAGQDALIVSDERFPMSGLVTQRFASIEEAGMISVSRFGVHIRDYTLHVGRGYIPRN
ncbi:MAG: glycosyltransferase family 39 protein [Rhizobiaceae bacterium]